MSTLQNDEQTDELIEDIGKPLEVTEERVRQIEEHMKNNPRRKANPSSKMAKLLRKYIEE